MPLDLVNCSPRQLAAEASLEELLAAVESVREWTDRPAAVLDHVYVDRVVRALRGPAAEEELRPLSAHLGRVVHVSRREALDGLERHYASRWEGFRDALERAISRLRARDVEGVLARAHVRPILEALAEAPSRALPQSELRSRHDLGKANLTRILNLMELNGLVTRRGVGRENLVSLTEAGHAAVPVPASAPRGAGAAEPRGLDLFKLRQTAA